MIRLIVGLGNPGSQYEKTRHNVGFLFLNHLMGVHGSSWSVNGQFQGEIGSLSSSVFKLDLLKPMTFMNRSGSSVGKVLRYYRIAPEELLVVHDELELPEGAVRLKRDGGHAGHNGLRDIIAQIDSRDFYRLRVGIGRPVLGSNIADYVLSKLSSQAFLQLDGVFSRVESNFSALIEGDVERFNQCIAL